MTAALDVHQAFRLVALFAATGIAVTTAEFLFNWRDYRPDGLYSWIVARERRVLIKRPSVARIAEIVLDAPGFWVVLGLRLAAAVAVVIGVVLFGALPGPAVVLLLVTTLVISFRHSYGMDGSDQMSSLIVVALSLYVLFPQSPVIALAALWFVALQSCLSYFASGVAKAASPKWRRGTAVLEVLNTASYGRRDIAHLLHARPRFARLLNWSVIVFECAFPVAVLAGGNVALAFLGAGLLMHLGIAVAMGLNSFVWAFVATYPAVLYCSASIR